MEWTAEQIETLVTDAGVLRDGRALATSGKWSSAGRNAVAAWGLALGSGKAPYRVSLLWDDGAQAGTQLQTKCTCPSRKFPCKHAVGLMFRLSAGTVEQAAAPDWVEERLLNRAARQQKSVDATKNEADSQEAERKAAKQAQSQAKRENARETKVAAGIAELSRWLEDLIRMGIGDTRARNSEFWSRMAARMVDAQAPGLAKRLHTCATITSTAAPGWEAELLHAVGSLHLLLAAYTRLQHLPAPLQHDVRTAIGWTIPTGQVLEAQGIRDQWQVMAVTYTTEERLVARRVWLYGLTGKQMGLLLDYTPQINNAASAQFARNFAIGSCLEAELVYYPSALPQRALIRSGGQAFSRHEVQEGFIYTRVDDVLNAYAEARAVQPWLDEFPAGLHSALLYPIGDAELATLHTGEREYLPAQIACDGEFVVGLTGLHPIPVFGIWNGTQFYAQTVWAEGRYVALQSD